VRVREPGAAGGIGIVSGILVVEAVFFFDKIRSTTRSRDFRAGVNGAWGCLSIGSLLTALMATAGMASRHRQGTLLRRRHEPIWLSSSASSRASSRSRSFRLSLTYRRETVGNRVSVEVEIEGLDVPRWACPATVAWVMDKQSETRSRNNCPANFKTTSSCSSFHHLARDFVGSRRRVHRYAFGSCNRRRCGITNSSSKAASSRAAGRSCLARRAVSTC